MARVYDIACFRRCFSRWQPESAVNAQEELETSLEMLEVQERRINKEIEAITCSARTLLMQGRRSEARAKLSQRTAARKRAIQVQAMQANTLSMLEHARGTEVLRYGIKAMHNMARELGGGTASMEHMYNDLTNAQDVFADVMNTSEDIQNVLQLGAPSTDDDELERELEELLAAPQAQLPMDALPDPPAQTPRLRPQAVTIDAIRARIEEPMLAT